MNRYRDRQTGSVCCVLQCGAKNICMAESERDFGMVRIIGFVVAAMVFGASGCADLREGYKGLTEPEPVVAAPDYDERKFDAATAQQEQSAVENAIELSRKYAQATEELGRCRLENERLAADNAGLKNEMQRLNKELTQAENELSEANRLLLDMRVELGKWKHDVLGFRKEMRQAEQAQLEALAKVLQLLGAEPEPAVTAPAHGGGLADPNEPAGG